MQSACTQVLTDEAQQLLPPHGEAQAWQHVGEAAAAGCEDGLASGLGRIGIGIGNAVPTPEV